MTQTDKPYYANNAIDVVCDHCSSGYHVSIMHFADSFKYRFKCPSCQQSWTEYLDIPIWEELRGSAQELKRLEQEREDALLAAEMAKIRAQEAEERAAREAEEEAKKRAEEQRELEEAQKREAEEAERQAIEEEKRAAEAIEGAQEQEEETADLEAEGAEGAEKPEEAEEESAKPKRKSKKARSQLPKGVIGKTLFVLNPLHWGQLSIGSLSFTIFFLVLVYAGIAGYFYVQRAEIVQANPLAAGPYHAVGIPVSPVDGLTVRILDIERKDIAIPGERTQYEFNIRAKVRNFSETERRLPYLRFSAQNLDGERLEFWDVNLTGRVLQTSEEQDVAILLPKELTGDERIESFVARLISKAEREYLGPGEEVENIAATSL